MNEKHSHLHARIRHTNTTSAHKPTQHNCPHKHTSLSAIEAMIRFWCADRTAPGESTRTRSWREHKSASSGRASGNHSHWPARPSNWTHSTTNWHLDGHKSAWSDLHIGYWCAKRRGAAPARSVGESARHCDWSAIDWRTSFEWCPLLHLCLLLHRHQFANICVSTCWRRLHRQRSLAGGSVPLS